MRYFIAHLVSDDIRHYHEAVIRDLNAHRIQLPERHTPPHITIKPPFECDRATIDSILNSIERFVAVRTVPPFMVRGFGKFGFKTIYLNVENGEATRFVRDLVQQLNQEFAWLPRRPVEGDKLHLSVARRLDRVASRRAWRAVKDRKPKFISALSSIVILERGAECWHPLVSVPCGSRDPRYDFTPETLFAPV